ncbi:MAG: hypothetical protein AMXMBFR78_34090 [Rubrivivax sp.]
MNGILYRALVGRFDSNEPECFVFFECPPLLHPATELARLLSAIWWTSPEELDICNVTTEHQLFTSWCLSDSARSGDARLFESGMGDDGRVHYAEAERTLFLVGSPTLARLVAAQRLALALWEVGFRVDRAPRVGATDQPATAEEVAA